MSDEEPTAESTGGLPVGGLAVEPAAASPEEEQLEGEDVLEDAREDALDFLEGLLDAMEADGDVSAGISEHGVIEVAVEGGDAGLLIGSRGQTLDAMQELLRTVVQRQAESRVRVVLDVDGYRERRREAVLRQAEEAARLALEDGEADLDPMSAYERKLVHQAIADIEGLSSFSEGQEPRRRVRVRRNP
ncbi:MAG: Jag family protein [Actinomycetota bacterium]